MEKESLEKEIDKRPKKRSILKKVLFLFSLFLILFYIYIRYIETSTLVVHEHPIYDNHLPSSYDGTKIVHFSDILYGSTVGEKMLTKTVKKINELKGDIVVFTGDLFNDTLHLTEKDNVYLKEKLSEIEATYRKYAVVGNCDVSNLALYKDIMENAGFTVLENKNELLYFKGNEPLLFVGTSSLIENQDDIASAFQTKEDTTTAYKILLHHEPTIIDELQVHNIHPNLILAGHSLYGLSWFPFGGTLLKQKGVDSYTSFYYENENTKMFVSNGIGTYKLNIRFLNYSSIHLYRLYSHL